MLTRPAIATEATGEALPTASRGDLWARLPRPLSGIRIPAAALALTALATIAGIVLSRWLPHSSVSLAFLLAVVVAAVGLGLRTGLAVALFSFPAYNFFFIPPLFTFTVADPQELFALLVFLAVALLTGSLAGRMREVADDARRQATALQSLNDFAGRLATARDRAGIMAALARQAAETVRGEAVVLTGTTDGLKLSASMPADVRLETADMQLARHSFNSRRVLPATAPGWPGARMEFHPIMASGGAIGVIGLAPADGRRSIGSEDRASLDIMLRHTAIAIERAELETETLQARGEAERERLRSALLSSLSHDLRTPLASILGAATSLRELGAGMAPETQIDLLAAIEEEAQRLSRFVANLLDMTRLEAGDPDLLHDWIDLGDVARLAIARARRIAPGANIAFDCPATVAAVRGDSTLLEHVVFNLLDNAIKFSGPGDPITVTLAAGERSLALSMVDAGRGIPSADLTRILEPFFRVRAGDGDVAGTGLGLAICKRVIEGMGGAIRIDSPVAGARGTRVRVTLPVPPSAGFEERP